MTSRLFKLWEKERIARAHRDLNEEDAEGGAAGMLNQASAEGDDYPFAPAGYAKGDRLCHVPDCTIPPTDDTCEAHR